jgi:hypothetical protein
MIEGITGAAAAAPQLQSPQAQKTTEATAVQSGQAGNSVIDASGSGAVGPSDVPSTQSVNQPPSVSSPGPENDFGQRGTLLDIAA